MDTHVTVVLTTLLVILIGSLEIESKGGRGGGARFSVRSRYSRSRYSRTRYSRSSTAWTVGIVAGSYYGSRSYMRRRRWYSSEEPSICTNYYDKDINGTVYGRFICPMEGQADNLDDCCGEDNKEKCCEETLSAGQIAGLVVAVLAGLGILCVLVYYCFVRARKASHRGTVLSPTRTNPAPLPATKYTTQPQDASLHSTVGYDGINYGMSPDSKAPAPPDSTPYGMNPVQPPSYDSTVGGSMPYPQSGDLQYPPPPPEQQSFPATGQMYPPPSGGGAYPPSAPPYTISGGQPYPPPQ